MSRALAILAVVWEVAAGRGLPLYAVAVSRRAYRATWWLAGALLILGGLAGAFGATRGLEAGLSVAAGVLGGLALALPPRHAHQREETQPSRSRDDPHWSARLLLVLTSATLQIAVSLVQF